MNNIYMIEGLLQAQAKNSLSWQTIVALVVIGILVIAALIKYIVDKKKGKKCAGGCAGCPVSSCPSQRPYETQKEQNEDKVEKTEPEKIGEDSKQS